MTEIVTHTDTYRVITPTTTVVEAWTLALQSGTAVIHFECKDGQDLFIKAEDIEAVIGSAKPAANSDPNNEGE